MAYIKAGYVVRRALGDVTEKQARQLDVINIAFGLCVESKIKFDGVSCLGDIKRIRGFNPDIKILLSVGGWGAGGFSPMAASGEGRDSFAESALDVMRDANLDGIDIDWEYPCIDSAGIEASPDDRVNFTLMLAALREKLDTVSDTHGGRAMLTAAVGSGQYFIDNTEMDKVAKLLNYVSLMTYDMRGSWTKSTGHHTNLMSGDEGDPASVLHSVKIYKAAGVPREKLIIGAAFYSRIWKGVKNENHGLHAPASQTGGFGPSYGDLAENYIGHGGWVEYWDDDAKAPWLFNGESFLSYDNPKSIALKCRYVKEAGLGGIMYWEHSCDKTGELLDTIYRELK